MLLTRDDVKQLTGRKRPAAQIAWLKDNGWKFSVNALGEPNVAVAEFNRHQVGGRAASSQTPDFGAINGTAA